MSQDNQVCEKCKKKCGYDDGKVYFDPGYLCGQCRGNLANRFCSFFGLTGGSYGDLGLEVAWREVDKILGSVKRDDAMRLSYIVTDKEMYNRTKTTPTPIEVE